MKEGMMKRMCHFDIFFEIQNSTPIIDLDRVCYLELMLIFLQQSWTKINLVSFYRDDTQKSRDMFPVEMTE